MDHTLQALDPDFKARLLALDPRIRDQFLMQFRPFTQVPAPRVSVSHVRREIYDSRTAKQNRAISKIKTDVQKAFTQTPAASHTFSFVFDYETYLNAGFIEDAVQSVFDEPVNVTTVQTDEGFTVVVRLF